MARIRSVHPGLFTDEAFVSVSRDARLLLIGVWCEAWDDGVFDWKPLTLKMRVFPADNVDVGGLLEELLAAGIVQKFDTKDGRKMGVVRNFQRFQRPKKPNRSGVLPDNLSVFAGASETGSEPVPNRCGTGGEKSPQMEDGEGGVEGREVATATSPKRIPPSAAPEPAAGPPDFRKELFGRGLEGLIGLTGLAVPTARTRIGRWLKDAGDEAVIVLDAIDRAVEGQPADPGAWITAAIAAAMKRQPGATRRPGDPRRYRITPLGVGG